MGPLRIFVRALVAAALAAGLVAAGSGMGAQAIPPEGAIVLVAPGSGRPGSEVMIRGARFACSPVELSWAYSNGELEILQYLGTASPKNGAFSRSARVPEGAAQGWSTIFAEGPRGCGSSVAFYVCTVCLGDGLLTGSASARSH